VPDDQERLDFQRIRTMSHFRAAAANARPTITVDWAGAGVVSHPGTYPPVDVDLADQQASFGGPVASDSPSLQLIDVIDKAGGSPKQARRSTTGLDPATAVNPRRVLRPHGIGSAGGSTGRCSSPYRINATDPRLTRKTMGIELMNVGATNPVTPKISVVRGNRGMR
jgi:hypothetical protein